MKTNKELKGDLPNRVAYWINEFIEKRCCRISLRKQIMNEFNQALQAKEKEVIEEVEKVIVGTMPVFTPPKVMKQFNVFLEIISRALNKLKEKK